MESSSEDGRRVPPMDRSSSSSKSRGITQKLSKMVQIQKKNFASKNKPATTPALEMAYTTHIEVQEDNMDRIYKKYRRNQRRLTDLHEARLKNRSHSRQSLEQLMQSSS